MPQSFFLRVISDSCTAILAPSTALFLISAILERAESPSVNSFIRFKRNGVISAPFICCYSPSSIACAIAF
jgi:hypothetical protein